MKSNTKLINSLRIFSLIAPLLVLSGISIQISLRENQGEFPENLFPLCFALLIMILNLISLITLWTIGTERFKDKKLFNAYSILLGTPLIILLALAYQYTLAMNITLGKTRYLRDECYMKWRNVYKAENRYHFSTGYCPTATQDSIIVTEIYRTGKVKSCGIILNDKYHQIDTSEISFLTKEEKKEILSY